jgi:hypothetical protein
MRSSTILITQGFGVRILFSFTSFISFASFTSLHARLCFGDTPSMNSSLLTELSNIVGSRNLITSADVLHTYECDVIAADGVSVIKSASVSAV